MVIDRSDGLVWEWVAEMELHQLKYFVHVAETLSFSRAAERCHVAQPSLSQQIRKLENELGYRLFDRMSRGVAMTEAGRALLPRARRILGEVHAVDSAIADDIAVGRGPLLVGAIPTMAPFFLPVLVKRFTDAFPECQLTLREDFTENLVVALLDHELDLAIMSTPIDEEMIQLEVIDREKLLLVTARGYPLPAGVDYLAIEDLRDQPAIVLHEMHCLSQQIDSFCSARGVSRRIFCRSSQLSTVLELVGLGLGVSLVPEMCARADVSESRYYQEFGADGPVREIAAAYRVDRSMTRLGRAFISMLREQIQSGRHRFDCAAPAASA
jgi:LysR family hydrogen peroxide-inducible transcriptional activator